MPVAELGARVCRVPRRDAGLRSAWFNLVRGIPGHESVLLALALADAGGRPVAVRSGRKNTRAERILSLKPKVISRC